MSKPIKKIGTNEASIKRAEDALGIVYPPFIRQFLIEHNGGMLGYFERVYPVKDDNDIFHTFDDVVRENTNPRGWKTVLPEGYVAIADDGGGMALVLSTQNDSRVYTYLEGEIELLAASNSELESKLNQQAEEIKLI